MTTIIEQNPASDIETSEANSDYIATRFEKIKRLEDMLAEIRKKPAETPKKYNKDDVMSALASLNDLLNKQRNS